MNKFTLSLSLALLWLPLSGSSSPMVELFTSQGCYSCPAADEFLADLIEEQPDLVALEFHVDYWDDLHYGAAGVWKDPFSNPEYTSRQRRYNAKDLVGKRGVYTPQMIVNGSDAQVGSSRRAVYRALKKKAPEVNLEAAVKENLLSVDIKNTGKTGSILWLAVFDRVTVTEVERGENHGKTMVNHNVVRELLPLGRWQGDKVSQTFQMPASAAGIADGNRGCAIFLQDETLGKISGATYCQTTES